MNPRGCRTVFPATALVIAALALSACGGSSSTTTGSAPAPKPAATSASAASAPAAFRQTLIDRSGFTPKQATCIEQAVLAKIGKAQFEKLYGKGSTPERVKQVILNANLKCAPNGAGQ